jgi:beta-glucosidase
MPQGWGYRLQWVDSQTPVIEPINDLQPTLLQLFIQAKPFQNTTGLIHIARQWLESLLEAGQLQAVILYGSPYVWKQFVPLLPSELPAVFSYWSNTYGSGNRLRKASGLGVSYSRYGVYRSKIYDLEGFSFLSQVVLSRKG